MEGTAPPGGNWSRKPGRGRKLPGVRLVYRSAYSAGGPVHGPSGHAYAARGRHPLV